MRQSLTRSRRRWRCPICNFLSAIYLRAGRKLVCEPLATDSHSVLMAACGVRERDTNAPVQQFVRLELTPPEGVADWSDLAAWNEKVDEHEVPDWFDAAARFDAFEGMRGVIQAALDAPARGIVLGRLVIISEGKVEAHGCRVMALDSSQATLRDNSQATLWGSSQATLWDSSQATLWDSSQATLRGSSQATLRDNSQATLRDNSQATLLDSSQATLRGSSTATLLGSSTATLWGSSTRIHDERPQPAGGVR